MKRLLWAVLLVSVLGAAFVAFRHPSSTVTAIVSQEVLVKDTVPFGLNLGSWTFWGAEQLMSNVVKNPGFEGLIDGAIVLPVHSGDGNFDDSPAWLARPDAFWEGARYSIRTGAHTGAKGTIAHSAAKNLVGLPSFTVENEDPLPEPGEAVALLKERETELPTQWWFSKDSGNAFAAERNQVRPGSHGTRSLRISAGSYNPAEAASYLDSIGERAGKLLPLTGQWTLDFWAKLDRGHASFRAVVGRDGSRPVLARSTGLTGAWQHFQFGFDAGADDGPAGVIALRFQVQGDPAGDILLDDVDLRQDADAGFPFRAAVVSTLQTLHPSYLRDWQGQLADTLRNRIAPAFARKSWRYRPGDENQTDFGYGLGDFIELANRIGAAPWIVIPTAFTDEDCSGLGAWLASPGRLKEGREILVEFGNENWNELFRPAGIADPVVHGRAADRCLGALRHEARGIRLKTVVNAQFANVERAISYGSESHAADIVAVAPYFGLSMPSGLTLARRNGLLFEARDAPMRRLAAGIRQIHKELAVYEVNMHTVAGAATEAERRPAVAGLASGTALARTLLDALAHGIRRQCVYSFAGFDAGLQTVKGYAPLWGIVRDLRAPGRFRPTGLALRLLNDTVAGNMLKVDVRGQTDVSVYAFNAGGRFSIVALSGSAETRQIDLQYAAGAAVQGKTRITSMRALAADSSNEDSQEISVTSVEAVGEGHVFSIEPWGMIVIQPLGSR